MGLFTTRTMDEEIVLGLGIIRPLTWRTNLWTHFLELNKAEIQLARSQEVTPGKLRFLEKMLLPATVFDIIFLPYTILLANGLVVRQRKMKMRESYTRTVITHSAEAGEVIPVR